MDESTNEFEKAFEEAVGEDSAASVHTDAAETSDAPVVEPETEKTEAEVTATASPEPEAAQAAQPAGEPEVDWRKKYEEDLHRYKSDAGRYAAEARKRQELEKELKDLRAQQSQASIKFDPDDIEKEEIERFNKENPEVAKLTTEGPRSKIWQKMLVERGADEVIAIYEASQTGVEAVKQEVQHDLHAQKASQHLSFIESHHPDWKQLIGNPAPQHDQDTYNPEFVQWVRTLPFDTAQEVVRIVDGGSAPEIVELLNAYKKIRSASAAPAQTPPATQAAAPKPNAKLQAALAVPAKGAPPPKAKPDPNDFASAWAEATANG